jgi:hypothetical protein
MQICHRGGRGGIRTHGGFLAHARFRVECLKPDSATLPDRTEKGPTLNARRPTFSVHNSNTTCFAFGSLASVNILFRGTGTAEALLAWLAAVCFEFGDWRAAAPSVFARIRPSAKSIVGLRGASHAMPLPPAISPMVRASIPEGCWPGPKM